MGISRGPGSSRRLDLRKMSIKHLLEPVAGEGRVRAPRHRKRDSRHLKKPAFNITKRLGPILKKGAGFVTHEKAEGNWYVSLKKKKRNISTPGSIGKWGVMGRGVTFETLGKDACVHLQVRVAQEGK